MKNFIDLEKRLRTLIYELDGDFWLDMVNAINPPKTLPPEQPLLDMVYRDTKAVGGYVPDLMAIMRKNVPQELDPANREALKGILSYLNLLCRMLLMILVVPRYADHEDLINNINAYRQTMKFIREYLEVSETALA